MYALPIAFGLLHDHFGSPLWDDEHRQQPEAATLFGSTDLVEPCRPSSPEKLACLIECKYTLYCQRGKLVEALPR